MNITLTTWQLDKLKNTALKLGDSIELFTVNQSKKRLKLLRQSYLITTEPQEIKKPWIIEVEPFKNEKFALLIEWKPLIYQRIIDGIYTIKSLDGQPIKLNGSYVTEGLLERGDKINFGLNQIETFSAKKSELVSEQLPEYFDSCIKSNLPVLIEGETGTGKTSLAKKIHDKSGRSGRFVHLNLSSFSANLLESELFGHIKGAFTGAHSSKEGAFSTARNGTLFLDEIDSLSKELQVKLLLFLDSSVYRPVGSTLDQYVKTRIIFASGTPLEQLKSNELMRQDFFYRLRSGFKFSLPSLNSNPDLIKSFIEDYSLKHGVTIDPKLTDFYLRVQWAGNYREIKAHLDLKRDISNCNRLTLDKIDHSLLRIPRKLQNAERIYPLAKIKEDYILLVNQKVEGDVKLGAKLLDISPATFRTIVKKSIGA